ncbi:class I SAM-dependent methyltransferase [Methyloversatilis sp.]|uniref:class I SAM-dependent methyltransferase n=1 Tax=Methyloversatilis sp. TaxID=2569862 RepID=UPI0035B353B0
MGDNNQLYYLRRHVPRARGPVLEIGSKDYGSTVDFRSVYRDQPYVGLDLADGRNVDVVHDLTQGTGPLPLDHFDLAICCSVLEHVDRPWEFARHVSRVVRPGGRLYMSVPWVWRFHAYPDDYFRFSWRGIEKLFPDFDWSERYYSTNVDDEFISIDEFRDADNRMALLHEVDGGARKHLPYLMVNMLGTRRHEAPAAG